MLTPGSRIGPAIVLRHVSEGLFGDSYEVEAEAGRGKGEKFLVKVLPRELVERPGFSENFLRECQVIEQLDQDGIMPLESYGVTKWKHWLRYRWEPGIQGFTEDGIEKDEQVPRHVCTLEDYLDVREGVLPVEEALAILISILNGLLSAHAAGLAHGNLKPRNVLLSLTDAGEVEAKLTELGFVRLTGEDWFRDRWRLGEGLENSREGEGPVDSIFTTWLHRSPEERDGADPHESGDIFAVGLMARRMLSGCSSDKVRLDEKDNEIPFAWKEWLGKCVAWNRDDRFQNIGRAMVALPGIGDVSRFGLSLEEEEREQDSVDTEELRRKREEEWEAAEKARNRKALRGITGLVGGIFLAWYLISTLYYYFYPSPWVEYKHEAALDSYQMGTGLWSGKAYGVTPRIYDPRKTGGQDVPGEWSLEDGLFRFHFRKYKHVGGGDQEGRKRWKDMGLGSTSSEDYYQWSDYLLYDRSSDAFVLVKRVGDDGQTYLPVSDKDGNLRFFPEGRMGRGKGRVTTSELRFEPEQRDRSHWSLFFGVGFLFASFLYRWEKVPVMIKSKKSSST